MRRSAIAVGLLAGSVLVAGCGGDDGTSLTGGGPPDDGGDLGIELDTPVDVPVDDAGVTVTIDALSFEAPQDLIDQQIVTSAYVPVFLDVTIAVSDDYPEVAFFPEFYLEGSDQVAAEVIEGESATELGETTHSRLLFNVPGEAIADIGGEEPVAVDSLVLYDSGEEIGRLEL